MSATGNLDARIPPPQPSFVLVRPPRAARELSWGITTDASLASLSGIPAVIEFAARERSRRARSGASISSNIVADEEVVVVHDRRDTAEALAAPVAAAVDADNDAEYSHVEYTWTAALRPVEFAHTLRSVRAGRVARVLIGVTLYNEEGEELAETLTGVVNSLPSLALRGIHWSEVVVCVVCDGRTKMAPSMARYATDVLKAWDARLINPSGDAQLHLFEHTVELPRHATLRYFHAPLQVIFAVKERNAGKLSSHAWLFSAFARLLNPQFVVLLDVGTAPREGALGELIGHMMDDPSCGGCAGEIAVRGARWHRPLDVAQVFEYGAAHVLDKPLDSLFGFQPVLPGAFSAYRWLAVRGMPLESYLKREDLSIRQLTPFAANKYLAEDRVLCFEICAQPQYKFQLHYVPTALADTDVPQTLVELLKQRRRWLNGTVMASLFYLEHFPGMLTARHSLGRKAAFLLQWAWIVLCLIASLISPAYVYLSGRLLYCNVVATLAGAKDAPIAVTATAACIDAFFALSFVLMIVFGLAGRVNNLAKSYGRLAAAFAVFALGGVAGSAYMLVLQLSGTSGPPPAGSFGPYFLYLSMAAAVASFLGGGAIHGPSRFMNLLLSLPSYLAMAPVWLLMMPVFSFAQLHDVSWGTKEGATATLLQTQAERTAKSAAARADAARGVAQGAAAALGADSPGAARAHALSLLPGGAAAVVVPAAPPAPPAEAQLLKEPSLRRVGRRMGAGDEPDSGVGEGCVSPAAATGRVEPPSALPVLRATPPTPARPSDLLRAALAEVEEAAAEAACARAAAEQLGRDRDTMAAEYNSFRVRALVAWLGLNVAIVTATLALDPALKRFAEALALTVLLFTGVRLLGSAAFQLSRGARAVFRAVCGACYAVESVDVGGGGSGDRVACCCRGAGHYDVDRAWRREHGAHARPRALPPGARIATQAPAALVMHPPPHRASAGLGPACCVRRARAHTVE